MCIWRTAPRLLAAPNVRIIGSRAAAFPRYQMCPLLVHGQPPFRVTICADFSFVDGATSIFYTDDVTWLRGGLVFKSGCDVVVRPTPFARGGCAGGMSFYAQRRIAAYEMTTFRFDRQPGRPESPRTRSLHGVRGRNFRNFPYFTLDLFVSYVIILA